MRWKKIHLIFCQQYIKADVIKVTRNLENSLIRGERIFTVFIGHDDNKICKEKFYDVIKS